MEDNELDDLFEAARKSPQAASAGLLHRIIADAEAELALDRRKSPTAVPAAKRWPILSWFRSVPRTGAAAGLLSATLAGFWIGFVQPQPMSEFTLSLADTFGFYQEDAQVDLLSLLDSLPFEG